MSHVFEGLYECSVFLDETSKNRSSINRTHGWGLKSKAIHNKGFVLRGKRVSVLAAYTLQGLNAIDYTEGTYVYAVIAPSSRITSFSCTSHTPRTCMCVVRLLDYPERSIATYRYNAAEFEDWFIRVLLPSLRPYPQPNSIVIIDNAAIHDRQFVFDACMSVGAVVLFMSAYSPDLNPIERMWAMAKAYLKRRGGYHVGNDNRQQMLLEALDHAHLNMNHLGNFEESGWVLDANGRLDLWAPLPYD